MTATMTGPAANGRQQKTLSHQLDRLDAILDGLAEALNESVAAAVRDAVAAAVREAVEVALKEVLSRPELLRAALAAHGGPAAGAAEPVKQRAEFGQRLRRAWSCATACARGALARGGPVASAVKERTGRILMILGGRAAALVRGCGRAAAGVATLAAAKAVAAARAAWRRRMRLLASTTAGTATGVLGYVASPLAAAVAAGL